jgi:hypothetical protein
MNSLLHGRHTYASAGEPFDDLARIANKVAAPMLIAWAELRILPLATCSARFTRDP